MMTNRNSQNDSIYDDYTHGQRYRFTSLERSKPTLYEQSVTTTTTTTVNKETNTKTDELTTTQLEKSPMRRVNFVTGPKSAFARLFPDRYQQQEGRRSKSTTRIDDQRYNFDRCPSTDDDYYETSRKSRRVKFENQLNDLYSSNPTTFTTRTKSESLNSRNIAQIPLNYDPDPEIIYRDNPNKVVYVQKVGVRYLKPPTPTPPEPIIIRERHATPPQEPPPLIISATPYN